MNAPRRSFLARLRAPVGMRHTLRIVVESLPDGQIALGVPARVATSRDGESPRAA